MGTKISWTKDNLLSLFGNERTGRKSRVGQLGVGVGRDDTGEDPLDILMYKEGTWILGNFFPTLLLSTNK